MALCLISGCSGENHDIVIVSKSLKNERAVNTGVPDEFSSFAPASQGFSVWVEGKVKNEGANTISNIEISFKCTEGVHTRVFIATVKALPAGKTADFKTRIFPSKIGLKLSPDEPEIKYDR